MAYNWNPTFMEGTSRPSPDQAIEQKDKYWSNALQRTGEALRTHYGNMQLNTPYAPGSVNPNKNSYDQLYAKAVSDLEARRAQDAGNTYTQFALSQQPQSSGFANMVGPLAGSFAQAAGGKLAGAAGDMLSKAGGWAWDAGKSGFSNMFGGGAPVANQGYGASAMEDALASAFPTGFSSIADNLPGMEEALQSFPDFGSWW